MSKGTKSKPIAPGVKVQTNAVFAKRFPSLSQWHGSVVREHNHVTGAWWCRVEGMVRLQSIHQQFLEVVS